MAEHHVSLAHPALAHLQDVSFAQSRIVEAIRQFLGDHGASEVSGAIEKAKGAGVPWLQILSAILPLLLSLFTGGSVDIAAIVQAILSLIHPAPKTA